MVPTRSVLRGTYQYRADAFVAAVVLLTISWMAEMFWGRCKLPRTWIETFERFLATIG